MRSPSSVAVAARAPHSGGAVCAAGAAALLLARELPAEQLAVTGIDFAPAVNAKWPEYGEAEAATLRQAIRAAVAREKECSAVPTGVGINAGSLSPKSPTLTAASAPC